MAGETVELTLEKTVFHGGRFIRKLKLRAPTQAEVDQACLESDTAMGRGLALISLVSGVAPMALAKLGEADQARLGSEFDRITGS